MTNEAAAATRGEGRPKRGYGKGKVSASTLANWYGGSYNLVKWAKRTFYDGALEGIPFEELDSRDLDIGTVVHSIIEADIHGDEWPLIPEDYEEAVQSAYRAWSKWLAAQSLTVVATEVSIASDVHGLGGTIDAILLDEVGNYSIGDWKTSKSLRSSYLVQLAIYGLLWEDENPKKPLAGGYHLLRFSKTGGNLAHLHFDSLDDALELALTLRRAYDMANAVKKNAGLAY